MKTFVVVPAAHGASYELQAAKVSSVTKETAIFTDDNDVIVAVVPLANVTVVYQYAAKR